MYSEEFESYFRLLWLLVLFVSILISCLCYLYLAMRKARQKESESMESYSLVLEAQEEERQRIARELHDTVAQDLWRLSFQTDSIAKTEEEEEKARLCAEVVKGQKEVMARVRAICDTLVPPDFQRRGLCDALRGYCYDFKQRTGIECQAVIQDSLNPEALDIGKQLQCFRIVQECLANVEKHAKAREVSVLVKRSDRYLEITVTDDGTGFAKPSRDSCFKLRTEGHMGIWNMFERAESINAALSFNSEEGEGTVITLRVPLNEVKSS
jgi:signal transduction histidine kinase